GPGDLLVGEPLTAKAQPFITRPGSALVVALLSDKWTIPVIHSLARGTKRTGQLRRELVGVSQKMLTQTLRNLEEHGLIERRAYPLVPPPLKDRPPHLPPAPNHPPPPPFQPTPPPHHPPQPPP